MATTHVARAEDAGGRFRPSSSTARVAAVIAAAGFLGLALFQGALAGGAQWGHAAWGGANAELSSAERTGSAVAVLLWTAAAVAVLGRAGLLRSGRRLARLYRWGTWVAALVCALASLANFASESRYEQLILGPLGISLAALSFAVARGRADEPRLGSSPYPG